MGAWERWEVGTAPSPIEGIPAYGTAIFQTGNTAPVIMQASVEGNKIYIMNKSDLTFGEKGWLFVNLTYACV